MTSVSLAQFSRRMATITLLLIILMLVLNAAVWLSRRWPARMVWAWGSH
jgi:high-affinity Fe2+/Pb2+ permease